MMYKRVEWRNGWMWIQSIPLVDFERATYSQMIDHLLEENQYLRDRLIAIHTMAEIHKGNV